MDFEPGPIGAFLEASATAVGVGMVLGGFAADDVVDTGYMAAVLCLVVRLLWTEGDPNGLEVIVIAVLSFGSAFGLCDYLNGRDRKLGRPMPPLPFRRSESDGEGPG